MIFNKDDKIIQWGKDSFFKNGARNLEASLMQEQRHASIRHIIRKLTQRLINRGASPVANQYRIYLPIQETRARSLGWEDPLEKDTATHCSTLAWKIAWRVKPGGLQSMGSQRVGHDWATNAYLLTSILGWRIPWSVEPGGLQSMGLQRLRHD